MKSKIITFFASLSCLLLTAGEKPNTLRGQLEDLNKFWIGREVAHLDLSERTIATDEIDLIKTHLSLVEAELRRASSGHLSPEQRAKRFQCLDILHAYWQRGIFPRNLYHPDRTPYFIDDLGTACAVGQLIVSTGFSDLAQQISKENNYGYIYDLATKYPGISQWANEFGFELKELAWIQPCYCNYINVETRNVSCHGGYDGYFKPDMSSVNNVKEIRSFKMVSGVWQNFTPMCGLCNIPAGKYKLEAKDENDVWHSFIADITEPSPPIITSIVKGDPSLCNATATVLVTNTNGSLDYSWSNNSSTTHIASGLCQQIYTVSIRENNLCYHHKTIDPGNLTSISEQDIVKIEIYPNPVKNSLTIQIPVGTIHYYLKVSIYNVTGTLCRQEKATVENLNIATTDLQPGIYLIKAESPDGKIHSARFLKE